MAFTPKQREYIIHAHHRWNIKVGAAASGKTWLDYAFLIPMRVMRCGTDGLIVLMGYTRNSLERNVLAPMREIWGEGLVGNVRSSDGVVQLFGRRCYAAGADKVTQVQRIQGSTVAYCYGDEVTCWHPEVFEMLKSRLRAAGSLFDGTCNPEHPDHWLKRFLDSGADVFVQHYTLDDNPYLPAGFAAAIKREYAGSVYYDRLVLGRWARAEGGIYEIFKKEPDAFLTGAPRYDFVQIGVDFGGNKSAFAFVACGLTRDGSRLTALCSERHAARGVTPEALYALFGAFLQRVRESFGPVAAVYADSAEQTLINGLKSRFDVPIRNSVKHPIRDRIRAVLGLMGSGRFFYTAQCESLRDALCDAVYDESALADVRLDDGTSDIDTLDAFEYAFERYLRLYARAA